MPVQRIESIIDVNAVQGEGIALVETLTRSQKALIDLYNTIQQYKGADFIKAGNDAKLLAASLKASNQAATEMAKANAILEKSIISTAKASKAQADASAAQVKADNEVIKQIILEEKAEQQLTKAKNERAKASQAAADVPFTTNLADLQAEQALLSKTGTVVNELDIAQSAAADSAFALGTGVGTANKQTSVAIISDEELAAAKKQVIKAQSEENVVLQGYKLQSSEANKAAKAEAASALGLNDAYKQLVLEYEIAQREAKNLAIDAIKLAQTHGIESVQAKKAAADAKIAATNALQLNSQIKAIDKSVGQSFKNVGNYTSAFGKAFGSLRQLAYILPGIGIAGIFNLAFEAIGKLTSGLDLFGQKSTIITRTFTDTSEKATVMKDALAKLGDTAQDIADKAMENLDASINKLNDDLGETPTIIEQAQAALKLLQKEVEETQQVFDNLSQNVPVDPSGLGVGGGFEELRLASKKKDLLEKQAQLQLKINEQVRKQNRKDLEEDLKDQGRLNVKFTSDNLQLQIDANEKIISNEKKSLGDRLGALKSNYDATIQLNILQKDKELFESNDNESKKALILEDYRYKNLKAQQQYDQQRAQLQQKAADEALKKAEENAKRLFKALGEYDTLLNEKEIAAFEELVKNDAVPPTFRIRALETLEESKAAIIRRSAANEIALNHSTSAEILAINQKAENDIYKLKLDTATKIAALQKITSDIDKKIQQDIVDRTKDANDEIVRLGDEANKKVNDNRAKRDTEAAKEHEEALKIYKDLERQAADDTLTFIQTLEDAKFTKEKNQLQALQDIRDQNYQKEIDNINNSSLSEQDKAAKIAVLNAQHDAQVAETARKEREINVKQAKFDKAITISKIIADTALAVIKQLEIPGPVGFAGAIAAGAIGAAQLAIAIATPIPTYFKGTDSSKQGWALTDERGPETYIEPSGNTFTGNDHPTLRYLRAGTKIIPHDQFAEQRRMYVDTNGRLKSGPDYTNDNRNADKIVKAVRSIKPARSTVIVDLGFAKYVERNVYK